VTATAFPVGALRPEKLRVELSEVSSVEQVSNLSRDIPAVVDIADRELCETVPVGGVGAGDGFVVQSPFELVHIGRIYVHVEFQSL